MMKLDGSLSGLLSIAVSSTVFCVGLSIGLQEPAALAVWPGVFIVATLQHFFVVAPAYLIITRTWGPVTQSPLWSFGLWGASLAAVPWLAVFMIDDAATAWRLYSGLLLLISISGISGGLIFGKVMRQPLTASPE